MARKQGIMPMRAGKGLLPAPALAAAVGIVCLILAALFFFFRPAPPALAVRPLPGEERDRCEVRAVMRAAEGTVAVTQRFEMVNRTGLEMDHAVIRFYLNAYRDEAHSPAAADVLYDLCYPEGFSPGGVTLMGVRWQGTEAEAAWTDRDETALRVECGAWGAGDTGVLTVSYVLTVPECRWRCQRSADLWVLGGALGIPAVFDPGRGEWRTDEGYPIGDPFVSDCMDYRVILSLEEGWTPFGSCPFEKRADGTWAGEMPCAREMTLLFSAGREIREKTFGAVRVRFLADGGPAEKLLDTAGRILSVYAEKYGDFPCPCLTVAAAPFPFAGMEYSGLIILSDSLFEGEEDDWELPLAHECAHQWFYYLVGSDQYNDPWQDEALCQWAVLKYVEKRYGADSMARLRYYYADAPLEERVGGGVTPGSPIDRFSDYDQYDTVVYGRGTAYLCALDTYTEGQTDRILGEYVRRYAWKRASRADFERTVNETAGMDLSAFAEIYLDTVIER